MPKIARKLPKVGGESWTGSPAQSKKKPSLLKPWAQTSSLQAGRQIHVYCLSHAIYGTLWRQPNKSILWSCYRKKRDDGKARHLPKPLGQRTSHTKSDVCEWKEESQRRSGLLERSIPGRPGDVLNNNIIDHSTVVWMDGWWMDG